MDQVTGNKHNLSDPASFGYILLLLGSYSLSLFCLTIQVMLYKLYLSLPLNNLVTASKIDENLTL